jgi:hypothetical protein
VQVKVVVGGGNGWLGIRVAFFQGLDEDTAVWTKQCRHHIIITVFLGQDVASGLLSGRYSGFVAIPGLLSNTILATTFNMQSKRYLG